MWFWKKLKQRRFDERYKQIHAYISVLLFLILSTSASEKYWGKSCSMMKQTSKQLTNKHIPQSQSSSFSAMNNCKNNVKIQSWRTVGAYKFSKTSVCRRSVEISIKTGTLRWFPENSCKLQTFTGKVYFNGTKSYCQIFQTKSIISIEHNGQTSIHDEPSSWIRKFGNSFLSRGIIFMIAIVLYNHTK